MEPITIRFMPTTGDYVRVMWHLQIKRLGLRALSPLFFLLAIVLCNFLYSLTQSDEESYSYMVTMSLYCLLAVVVLFVFVLAIFGISILIASYQISKQPLYRTDTVFRFSEDSFYLKDGHNELTQDWSNYQRVLAIKDYYILVFAASKYAGRFVPRRAFESQEQEAAFCELLKRKLKFKG